MDQEGAPTTSPSRSVWLLSETRRTWIALGLALVFGEAISILVLLVTDWAPALAQRDYPGYALLGIVIIWTLLALFQLLLTWLTYRGLSGPEFRHTIDADPSWKKWQASNSRARLGQRMFGFGPGSWSVTIAVSALLVVAALVLRPSLREVPVALGVAVVMVVASWASMAVVYAVHYARIGGDSLGFPGHDAEEFWDYLYVAFLVQTSFGAGDVEVRTTETRRVVTGQTLLAFAFNSVILATIVSLLLGIS